MKTTKKVKYTVDLPVKIVCDECGREIGDNCLYYSISKTKEDGNCDFDTLELCSNECLIKFIKNSNNITSGNAFPFLSIGIYRKWPDESIEEVED